MSDKNNDMNRVPVSLLYGTARAAYHRSVIPKEKTEKEVYIVKAFAEIQMVGSLPLLDIESCEDSNKKPDVICRHGDKLLRIQITELKSADQAGATSLSRLFVGKIIQEISKRSYSPAEKILVNIIPKFQKSNKAVKLKDDEIKKLVDLIIEGIKARSLSPSAAKLLTTLDREAGASLRCLKLPAQLKEKIRMVWLEVIPEGTECYCSGINNIYLGVDFYSNLTNCDLLRFLIDDVYQKKNSGFSDMLLIWSGEVSLYGDGERIANMLRVRFNESSFKHVYYFSFIEVDALYQQNRRAYRVV